MHLKDKQSNEIEIYQILTIMNFVFLHYIIFLFTSANPPIFAPSL